MKRKVSLFIFFAVCLLAWGNWWLARTVFAAGTTVVVNSSGDLSDLSPGDGVCDVLTSASSQCSLRAAIEELNALGPDTTPHRITFDIPGTGPFTITPGAELPALTVPVIIDGETQPGASCPTNSAPANLLIVLDGSSAGTAGQIDGLTLLAGSEGSTIRGLVIGNFDSAGIRILSGSITVRCNHLGVGADGLSGMANEAGVHVGGIENTIGGQGGPAQRNVISANRIYGISIASTGSNTRVRGNFVGTTADGLDDLGNGIGVYINGGNNFVGGANSLAGNVISGNGNGIRVNSGTGNIVQGNSIGVARDGSTPLPNTGSGVELTGASLANVVGGTAVTEANIIAHNRLYGVSVYANGVGTPTQNSIRGNIIYANGGLGIDLGIDGIDTNDPGDADGAENEHQNYPVLTTMPGSTIVTVVLESKPDTVYQIDAYLNDTCDPTGFGQGQEYFMTFPKQTDSQGVLQIQFSLGGVTGRYFTATATDPAGNTSEFSACALLAAAPTPTATATSTATPTATATQTPTATATNTPTVTGTAPSGPSPTPTSTTLPTSTPTPTGSATAAPTVTGQPPTVPPPGATVTGTPDPAQDDAFFVYLPLVLR